MRLPGMRGLSSVAVLRRAISAFNEDEMSTYAAALAYRALFALFPFIIFLVSLLGFLGLPELFAWIEAQAAVLVPAEAMDPVLRVVGELRTPQGGLLSFGIAVAIWSASVGVLALMDALNTAFDVKERRATWKRMLLSIVYTLCLAGLVIVAAAFMVLGPQVVGWGAGRLGLGDLFVTLWTWLRWPAAVVLLMLAVSLIYHAGPDARLPFRYVTPGAVLAVLVWIAASVGFGIYIARFADYNATYGSLGAIVILLFYFFLSAAVLLFGAEVNGVIEREAEAEGAVPPDVAHSRQ